MSPTKTSWEGKPKRQAKMGPNRTFAKLNNQPHKSQLGDKMIEGKGNKMGKVKIWVLSTKKRKRQRENCLKNNTKHKNE